jgi:hypothetical protein
MWWSYALHLQKWKKIHTNSSWHLCIGEESCCFYNTTFVTNSITKYKVFHNWFAILREVISSKKRQYNIGPIFNHWGATDVLRYVKYKCLLLWNFRWKHPLWLTKSKVPTSGPPTILTELFKAPSNISSQWMFGVVWLDHLFWNNIWLPLIICTSWWMTCHL